MLLAGSFGSYLSPATAVRIGLVPSCRCCGSCPLATSPAKAPRWPCCRCANAPGATALLEEVSYVELSDRADFNDRFVEQLAF